MANCCPICKQSQLKPWTTWQMPSNTFNRRQECKMGSTGGAPSTHHLPDRCLRGQSLRQHLLHALSSQLWNTQSAWQQYQFYRTEDLVWQLLYFEVYWILLSRDRRQNTPASSLQTYRTSGVCLSTLLFQARRPSEHTFHFKHMNCSTQNNKKLTVPLIDVLHILNVHLKRFFF